MLYFYEHPQSFIAARSFGIKFFRSKILPDNSKQRITGEKHYKSDNLYIEKLMKNPFILRFDMQSSTQNMPNLSSLPPESQSISSFWFLCILLQW